MGNYESVTLSASAELDVHPDAADEAFKEMDETLRSALRSSLREAKRTTANEDSYIHEWKI